MSAPPNPVPSPSRPLPPAPRARALIAVTLAAAGLAGLTGCPPPGSGPGELVPVPPTAALRSVELVVRPTNRNLSAYYCADLASDILFGADICNGLFGAAPRKQDLKFGFQMIFDLTNSNAFPIPMVELLLALDVFEGEKQAELAALCVSFCDPEAESCETPENPCTPPDKTVRGLEDFIPTANDLVRIATRAATGELFDEENLRFRVIPGTEASDCHPSSSSCEVETQGDTLMRCCGDTCTPLPPSCRVEIVDGDNCLVCPGLADARVDFELGLDATLSLLGVVAEDAVDSLLEGNAPRFEIPYTVLGTLFFDVPILGRFALEFGPWASIWKFD